jgi:DNA-binding transcriptional ArsR family regulator
MDYTDKLSQIKRDFLAVGTTLSAIGDETRQLIIMVLIDSGCPGMRVGEITVKTHLSRPSVSHHLKILLDAKIIDCIKKGTMNFYYISPTTTLKDLKRIVEHIEELLESGIYKDDSCKH